MESDYIYKVCVYKDDIEFPKRCACCFGHPDSKLEITYSWGVQNGLDKKRSKIFHVPYCHNCLEHVKGQKPSNRIVFGGAIAAILMLFARLWIMAIVLFILSIVAAFVYDSKFKKPGVQLKDECATLNEALTYWGFVYNRHIFNFNNEKYAKAFQKLNSDDPEITYEKMTFMSREKSV